MAAEFAGHSRQHCQVWLNAFGLMHAIAIAFSLMLVTHCSTSQQDTDVKTELDKLSMSVSEQEQVNNVNLYCFASVTAA